MCLTSGHTVNRVPDRAPKQKAPNQQRSLDPISVVAQGWRWLVIGCRDDVLEDWAPRGQQHYSGNRIRATQLLVGYQSLLDTEPPTPRAWPVTWHLQADIMLQRCGGNIDDGGTSLPTYVAHIPDWPSLLSRFITNMLYHQYNTTD